MMLAAASAGCAAPPDTGPSGPLDVARVIVRFATDVRDPADPVFLQRLAASARLTRIEVVRPMSGDAWVLRVDCADPTGRTGSTPSCPAALERLGALPNIQYVERDDRVTHR